MDLTLENSKFLLFFILTLLTAPIHFNSMGSEQCIVTKLSSTSLKSNQIKSNQINQLGKAQGLPIKNGVRYHEPKQHRDFQPDKTINCRYTVQKTVGTQYNKL